LTCEIVVDERLERAKGFVKRLGLRAARSIVLLMCDAPLNAFEGVIAGLRVDKPHVAKWTISVLIDRDVEFVGLVRLLVGICHVSSSVLRSVCTKLCSI
jgi:hypothetical protein